MRSDQLSADEVRIYYWRPIDSSKLGHMSLQTSQIYASFWPDEQPQFGSAYRSRGQLSSSLQWDIKEYGKYRRDNGAPDAMITVTGLDVKSINDKYIEFTYSLAGVGYDWGLFTTGEVSRFFYGSKETQNCSGLVFLLLKAGGMFRNKYVPELFNYLEIAVSCYITYQWFQMLPSNGDTVQEVVQTIGRLILFPLTIRSFMKKCYQVLEINNTAVDRNLIRTTLISGTMNMSLLFMELLIRRNFKFLRYNFDNIFISYKVKILEWFFFPMIKIVKLIVERVPSDSVIKILFYSGLASFLLSQVFLIYYYATRTLKTMMSPRNIFNMFQSFSKHQDGASACEEERIQINIQSRI